MLYYINQSFGSDSFYFATVRYSDGAMLYDGDDLPSAKAAAQADYEARVLSALDPSAGRAAVLEEAAGAINKIITDNGMQVCCGNGERSSDGSPECCGHPDVMINAGDVLAAIRALHPVADKPSDDGAQGEGWLPFDHPNTPRDGTEILAWRKDCGQFIASYTSCSAFPVSEAELDLLDEETLFKEDWFTQWPQALRLEGSEVPTHWRPLPSAPSEGSNA
ncbi:hypothetical protein [Ochrobactrum sp. Q0168]|uniref:hypothetical protein n=1 Tax=Ochrobactrum sp. Q0168 TaxID=2793241 RepID=UPI001AED1BFC